LNDGGFKPGTLLTIRPPRPMLSTNVVKQCTCIYVLPVHYNTVMVKTVYHILTRSFFGIFKHVCITFWAVSHTKWILLLYLMKKNSIQCKRSSKKYGQGIFKLSFFNLYTQTTEIRHVLMSYWYFIFSHFIAVH